MVTQRTSLETAKAAFQRAVERAGGQEKFAIIVGKAQPTISRRLHSNPLLWAEVVLKVEAATGVSRHDLRPDLYPREDPPAHPSAPPPSHGADGHRDTQRSGALEQAR
ncbi:MAG: helix-turn-helix domain-containing protein [Erythrobacter sp.]|nr:helix-turn-helix domain-containing protein [Erythrobacter sp.]